MASRRALFTSYSLFFGNCSGDNEASSPALVIHHYNSRFFPRQTDTTNTAESIYDFLRLSAPREFGSLQSFLANYPAFHAEYINETVVAKDPI